MEVIQKERGQIVDDIIGALEPFGFDESISILADAREQLDERWKNAPTAAINK